MANSSDRTASDARFQSAAGSPATKPKRRWLRFSLRTLFALVMAVGIFMVWLTAQLKWIHDRHEAVEWLTTHGGGVQPKAGTHAPIRLWMLGEAGAGYVLVPPNDGDYIEKGRELRSLFPEADMYRIRKKDGALITYWQTPFPE